MDDKNYLIAKFRDKASQAWQRDCLTHTNFLTSAEQATLKDLRRGAFAEAERLDPAPVVLWGGYEEAERKIAVFLPSYMDKESFLAGEGMSAAEAAVTTDSGETARPSAGGAKSVITCLLCKPLQARFADELTHRDFLGALMNLGLEREMIGDIVVDRDKSEAHIFVMTAQAATIAKELTRIKHTSVMCEEVSPGSVEVQPAFEHVEGFVSSERLDVILSLVYKLSRSKSQKLIEAELVTVDGRIVTSGGHDLKAGSRVTARGYGKFIYDGIDGTSRKGKGRAKVRVFR